MIPLGTSSHIERQSFLVPGHHMELVSISISIRQVSALGHVREMLS